MSLPDPLRDAVLAERARHRDARAAMLPALRRVQHERGWVSDDDLAAVADLLAVSRAELDNLATFYSLIFRKPVGERLVLLCDGVSCMLSGGDAVRDAIRDRWGIGYGQTTADGTRTLVNICCVGACDRAPAALVGRDRRLVGPVDPSDLSPLEAGP